ncbi:MAG: TetR/AcrR family transcriptional regulator [Actinomycetota bacterium]
MARATADQRARAADEVDTLVTAGLHVLARLGADALTVAEVLTEAGLSTRAFYRHFGSKDELLLAVYERDADATRERVRARLDGLPTTRAAIEAWIDETLALGFDPRRARHTRTLAREGLRLQGEFPAEFAAIVAGVLEPLVEALQHVWGAHPERDARTIHAICWELVSEKLAGTDITLADARAHVLRFCGPVLGKRM